MDNNWLDNGASPAGIDWHGRAEPQGDRAFVDANHALKQLWYLEKALESAHSVGRVALKNGKYATCFLVGPRLILTNHHVFGMPADASTARIEFGYRKLFNDELTVPKSCGCNSTVFITDTALDYTLVALDTDPGLPHLRLRKSATAALESHIAILQHPQGAPLQVAMRDNSLVWKDARHIQYHTNTDYGSSGSPVFNENWQVIALHSQRVFDPNNTVEKIWYRNQGTTVGAILANPAIVAELGIA